MIEKNKNWMLVSIGELVLSLVSLLSPVIKYTAGEGKDFGYIHSFNLLKLLDGESFVNSVLSEYRGSFLAGLSAGNANMVIVLLCVIGVAAIVLSFVGLRSMSKQYESMWPFILTLAGIVCTVIPAIALVITVLMSGDEFLGIIRVGAYAYVTPIAMIASCITVTRRHKLTRDEINIQKAARVYIRPAGDLPLQ